MIIPHLYLSDVWIATNMNELVQFNINTIINMTYEVQNKFIESFTYYKYDWYDNFKFNILDNLDIIVDQIHEVIKQNLNVLVHCKMGLSRSVTVIIAYLMKYNNMKFDEAYNFIAVKKFIDPNVGFIKQLRIYEEKLSQ